MTEPVTFEVDGIPVPQGSMKGIVNPRNGSVIITADNKGPLRSWRQDVAARAQEAGVPKLTGAVQVECMFRLQRPASVSEKRRPLPIVKPDVDKYARGVLDALTGIAYVDDAQVVRLDVAKTYGATPGMTCTVGPVALAVPVFEPAGLFG